MPETNIQDQPVIGASQTPNHIAIIMDGNGRWAEARGKKRVQGHKQGMERAREIVQSCGEAGVKALTLFAFSSENWQRPEDEVSFLMNLFVTGLTRESKSLHKNNVQLRVIGDVSRFEPKLQSAIADAETLTKNNDGLVLQIAANYGGQWDILQAANKAIAAKIGSTNNSNEAMPISQDELEHYLSGADLPLPDLMIRTGGEHRISNFLLWQCAYAELFFSPLLWPDFDSQALSEAIEGFANRERRYGKTGAQVSSNNETHN